MRTRIWLALAAAALAAVVAGPPPAEASARQDDGRVGVVEDLQGTVLVQPAGRQRWSPVGPDTVLLPGDRLRAMLRGAHAAQVGLAGGGSLVLGAGGLVRLEDRGLVHLVRGDAEVAGTTKRPVRVTGPGGYETSVSDAVVLRAQGDTTSQLDAPPRWLEGYRGSTTDEWMGSLVANVDGRNVPLSVGYHKVDVVIRDQIAVTTIEQSFVNATDRRLEGVFSFPLPAGASISGFGMWVGDELVQADIVERRRARQIYEDILRRRKDPGLLEWSGGNLFKASVFPIPAHGAKRIRLRYTQVLPLEGTRLRYRFALRSEMLRTTPLERLEVRIRNHSTTPLTGASSPTHDARVTLTRNDATLAFSAQEYTPERDFEAVFEVQRTDPLTVVPHRRGEDGYFMLMFAPPDPSAGQWQRDLLPEGDPLDLLFVVDTSGSMGPSERRQQRAFLAAVLALLGPEDRFRIMACDASVAWPVAKQRKVTEQNVERALRALDRRASLGWSDLDQALTAAAQRAGKGALVVYVGDGIGTSGDADPVALTQRIERMRVPAGTVFHAVATGSAYEQGVLEAISTLGGGTVRGIEGDPAGAAYAWLSEVAQPSVKNLEVAFDGIRTARVYPRRLPNLAAGMQQTVLGRFLPEGGASQSGRVIVRGTLDGEPVQYAADLVVAERESGNSFLPRLWARQHLDALLAEGRTPAIEEEIVSFSERFGIMTPYTSFLVLESDEDRERYGVTRRVHMRDGERFFAQARTAAATAALREQVRHAREWRLGLRRRVRAEIADLGRSLYRGRHGVAWGNEYAETLGEGGGAGGSRMFRGDAPFEGPGQYRGPAGELDADRMNAEGGGAEDEEPPPWDQPPADARDPFDSPRPEESRERHASGSRKRRAEMAARAPSGPQVRGGAGAFADGYVGGKSDYNRMPWLGNVLLQSFPPVPAPAGRIPLKEPPKWDDDVLAVLESVSAPRALPAGAEVGVELTFRESGGPRAPPARPGRTGRSLVGFGQWFARTRQLGQQALESWCTDQRGSLWVGTRLGRRRPATEADRDDWGRSTGLRRTDFARRYAAWDARIQARDGSLVVVRLRAPQDGSAQIVLTIDTDKRAIVQHDHFVDGRRTSSRRVTRFAEAGGLWWPVEETSTTAEGDTHWLRSRTVRELAADAWRSALDSALGAHDDVLFLGPSQPSVAAAEEAVHDGDAAFVDHLVVAAGHGAYQRWERAWAAWRRAREQEPGKPGLDWIELTLLTQSRRGEDLVAHAARLADALSQRSDADAVALALQLGGQVGNLQADERLQLLGRLERIEATGATDAQRAYHVFLWNRMRASVLQAARRWGQAVAIWRGLLQDRPGDPEVATGLLGVLVQTGDVDAALALRDSVAASMQAWPRHQRRQFEHLLAQTLASNLRFEALQTVAEQWSEHDPHNAGAFHAWLTALLARDRVEEWDAWIGARLDSALQVGKDPAGRAQLSAAVSMALGDDWGSGWSPGRVDETWARRLAVAARALAKDPDSDLAIVVRVLNHGRYQPVAARAELIEWLRTDLLAAGFVESIDAARLLQYVHWVPWTRNRVDAATWRSLTDRVKSRLGQTEQPGPRASLLRVVLVLLDRYGADAEAADLLREEIANGPELSIPLHSRMLIERLVRLPWTAALEDEILALLPRLVQDDVENSVKTQQWSSRVRWLADELMRMRVDAVLGPEAEREKLRRAELRERQRQARRTSRRGLADRFARAANDAPALLRPWLELERVCWLAELGADPRAAEGEARELLLSRTSEDEELGWVLRERSVLALSYLAVRRDAPGELADRVLALLRERLAAAQRKEPWRYALFRLLVALDRTDDLETTLRGWIEPRRLASRWRIALGYLLAESSKLKEAAEQFEDVARRNRLGEQDYVSLATWYLVLGDEARRQDALDRRYRVVDENQLANRVQQEVYRVRPRRPGEVPPDMDEEILRVIRVLLGKSSHPANRVGPVRALYRATKDFRLLASLADGVIGHTPGAVYPYLEQVGGVVQEVHEEATCDELRMRIAERAQSAVTDTDRRGLALLMAAVERRAAEVLDQPGPHVERSLAHLRQARKGAWQPGERALMARYLASLGRIPHAALAREQLAQLKELHRHEDAGTWDRLSIARSWHTTQWAYDEHDAAVDGLNAALAEYRKAQGGALPPTVNAAVDRLTGWFEHLRRFRAGETWLRDEAARQPTQRQQQWYARRRFALYRTCLHHEGTVSHGKGAKLYRAARDEMQRALREHAPDQLGALLQSYLQLHVTAAKRARLDGVGDDLGVFSRTAFVTLLPRFGRQQARQSLHVAEALHRIAGALPALTLLVERIEAEPAWYRRRRDDGWPVYSHRMARWRDDCDGSVIEPRLLAIVLRELEHDLSTGHQRARSFYAGPGHQHFWKAKADDFAAVARRVIAAHRESATVLHHTANYLWGGLRLRDEAIRTLTEADARGALNERGRWSLVTWLRDSERWQEMLPHAERLVAERPDNVDYRIENIRALHRVGRDEDGRALVDATQAHFRALAQDGHITYGVPKRLADLCLECTYLARSVALFEEAIRDHERQVRGWGGDEQLAGMYGSLARAHVGLRAWDAAVDAASAAIVIRGRAHHGRARGLGDLKFVLQSIPDLAAWIASYEEQAARTGMDAPVIRRTLALVWMQRNRPAEALRQLRVALRHRPDDLDLHTAVVRATKLLGDPDAVTRALLDSLFHVPAQPASYEQLAVRFRDAGDEVNAERALTGLAEYAPNEAEGHRFLAELRTRAGRHADAVAQWRHVVRIRTLELPGWLELARAQARAGERQAAHATLDELLGHPWAAQHRGQIERVSKQIDRQ